MTYKQVRFPVWITSYRHRNKIDHFLINEQTGEVQGQAPANWIKIALAVVLVIIMVAVIAILVSQSETAAALSLCRLMCGM